MTAQERRTAAWLQGRGWRQGYYGWEHDTVRGDRAGPLTMDQAVRAQTRTGRTAATAARDVDIRRADTDDEYRERALAAIRRVAERCETFTTDAVHAEDPTLAGTDAAAGGRALGPAMLHAAREGWIVATDAYDKSSRAQSNARPMRRWRSLIVDGQPGASVPTMQLAEVVGHG